MTQTPPDPIDAAGPPSGYDWSRVRPEHIEAAAAALRKGSPHDLRTVGWALLADADSRARYHGRLYRSTALSSSAATFGTALWVSVARTTTSLAVFGVAVLVALTIAAGGAWWADRRTRRAYATRVAEIQALMVPLEEEPR